MKYKINDWVWCESKGKAVICKIIASNADATRFVTTGKRCAVGISSYDIIAPVESKDIPIERPKPIGLFERVAYAINSISMRGQ